MVTHVIIQRHANTSVTTFHVIDENAVLTSSSPDVRLNYENNHLVYAGFRKLLDPNMEHLEDRVAELATSIFAVPGVEHTSGRNSGGSIIVKRDAITVVRDTLKTSDDEVESQIVAIITRVLSVIPSDVRVTVEQYRRSESFRRKVEESNAQFLPFDRDEDLFDDVTIPDVY